jgi:phage tail sheath protein FI
VGISERWELEEIGAFSDESILEVHRALLRLGAARADCVSILSLPGHWRDDETLAYVSALKSGTRVTNDILPLGEGESRAFSYGALYHPWTLESEPQFAPVRCPPDGTVVGAIARRSLSRGAWIAPANDPLAGVLGLVPRIRSEKRLDLLLAQVNLLRQEPHGILALSADTLSDDPDLRPLNIRRLMILLRRAALRLGNTYVFEPNDLTLRRVVRGAFESLLQRLFMGGAFAGATADTSYRVVLDEPVNNPQTIDRGQFFVELKVAPASPLSFLTIRLVQIGEQATATELI